MSSFGEVSIEQKQLLDGKLLKVFRDRVRLAGGGESVREWIDHPGASAVVPLFDDGTTLLIRQFRFPPRKVFIEVPAGKLDVEGEDPETVARRELEEETGWKAERYVHLGSLYPCIGYSNEIIHFFLAEDLTEGKQDLQHGEYVEGFRLPLEEAVRMALDGEVEDMKSVTALLMARDFLERRARGV